MVSTFGSVLGIDDGKRRNIEQWLPQEAILREEDEENDIDKLLFNSRLAIACKKLEAKDFRAAESQFETCLKDTAQISTIPQHDVIEIHLDLAAACNGAGNTTRRQSVLLNLTKLDLQVPQRLYLNHMLAVLYASKHQMDLARKHAKVAMEGRLKLHGRRDRSYHESLFLLVTICKWQNDIDSAEMYHNLLPEDCPINELQVDLGSSMSTDSISAIETLSKLGYNINKFAPDKLNANKKTYFQALNWAEKNGDEAALNLLLERWVYETNVSKFQAIGRQLRGAWSQDKILSYAAKNGLLGVVRNFLDQGADVNTSLKNGSRLLHLAICHTTTFELLLEKGANFEITNGIGWTPLLCAARKGQEASVRMLLERGANPTWRTKAPNNTSALEQAIDKNEVQVVRLLLEAIFKSKTPDIFNMEFLLMVAVDSHRPKILQLLLDKKDKLSNFSSSNLNRPFKAAILKGHIESLHLLLDAGANVNFLYINHEGFLCSALALASDCGHLDSVRILLKRGAMINEQARNGVSERTTALMRATRRGNVDVVRLLLKEGADASITWDGSTALSIATFLNMSEIYQILSDRC